MKRYLAVVCALSLLTTCGPAPTDTPVPSTPTPTKIAAAEVYDAMGKGAIDAVVSSWGSMYSRKFYEVSNEFFGPIWWTVWVNFINIGTWNNLSPEIQKINLGKISVFDIKGRDLDKLKQMFASLGS